MSEIMNVIANITGFITYFAPGYIFIGCFNYAACFQRESEIEYLIMKSISISYLFYVLANFVGGLFCLGTVELQAATFIGAILLGLILGKLYQAQWANNISLFLFKREMTDHFFIELWKNANANNSIVCVTLTMKDNLGIYEGQISKVSSYSSNPDILLSYYICYDSNKKLVSDYSYTDGASLLVRYSDIQKFEFELVNINAGG